MCGTSVLSQLWPGMCKKTLNAIRRNRVSPAVDARESKEFRKCSLGHRYFYCVRGRYREWGSVIFALGLRLLSARISHTCSCYGVNFTYELFIFTSCSKLMILWHFLPSMTRFLVHLILEIWTVILWFLFCRGANIFHSHLSFRRYPEFAVITPECP